MKYRRRRLTGIVLVSLAILVMIFQQHPPSNKVSIPSSANPGREQAVELLEVSDDLEKANVVLERLAVKGRAPKTDYRRVQFGNGWLLVGGCDTRNIILNRDLVEPIISDTGCKVVQGTLNDPYTGKQIAFSRGPNTSALVQIDHVVALSNAWQTGAQLLNAEQRIALANDPLELLAVDGDANQAKGDGDAATWLPANKAFRCQYVARQIAVKAKYQLWVTRPEKEAMLRVLATCPDQTVPRITTS